MLHVYQDNPVGGASFLNSLMDVNLSNPEDGQMMVYDASTQTWRNVTQKSLNDLAEVTDLTDIIATGTTNATGSTIPKGLYFYLNDELCQAKADIANGATFTLNTNYEEVTAGGLNSLNSALSNQIRYSDVTLGDITMNASGYLDIRSYIPAAPTGYGLLCVVLIGVTANSKADVPEIQGNGAYAYGEASKTYRSVSLRYIFLKISA